ncbi:fibronectin type III domain-containing protein [Acidicapsa acidisoli]|uniref:fibronectin type III domain-containing protein n=1 Tax=Acidicapsa acidisoli TaxID=1615681 RepID=UPI0021E0E3D0|nr:fibronectin type III domain-containing protein [Acidicapsa acidisoli]
MNLPRENGGFGLQYGTDINTAQLIAASNICDEVVTLAEGGTVPRYTCNGSIQVSRGRGSILQDLLLSCAGRISFSGGQYSIFPGAWVTPSESFTASDFVGPVEFKVLLSSRDVANGAKGVYTSPANNWNEADIPPYTQDTLHGYTTNQYLTQDNNEALYLTQNLPFTTDPATAQRILKIYMMRTRFQYRVTVRLSMKAFVCTPLDVITLTNPKYGWNNTTFEVLSATMINESNSDNPRLYMQLDLALTDPSIYDWSTSEELSATGYIQPDNTGGTHTATQPNSLTLYSGPGETVGGTTYPSTILSTASGINRNSLLVTWVQPNDIFVTSAGHIEIQYQLNGSSTWIDAGKVSGNATSFTIPNVTEGSEYNVQIRSVNMVGTTSAWVSAGPETISAATSNIAVSAIAG